MGDQSKITTRSKSSFRYFQYEEDGDSPGDARNVLIVVAMLIAAVAFQAGVNPPGGVWQDDKDGHKAGRAIYATEKEAYYVFLISNTLALSASVLVIMYLTYRFPFHLEVLVATAYDCNIWVCCIRCHSQGIREVSLHSDRCCCSFCNEAFDPSVRQV